MATNTPKRTASDALKDAQGVTEPTTDAEAALAAPGAPLAPAETPEAETDLAAAKLEEAEKAAVEQAKQDAKDSDATVVDGGTVSVVVIDTVAMVMDGPAHRTFPRGAKLKLTKEVAERLIATGTVHK